jgi:hypothetical protein
MNVNCVENRNIDQLTQLFPERFSAPPDDFSRFLIAITRIVFQFRDCKSLDLSSNYLLGRSLISFADAKCV